MAIWCFTYCRYLYSSGLVCACEWTCHVARSQYMWIVAPRLSYVCYMNFFECMHLGRCVWPFCEGWNKGAWLWSFTSCRNLFSSGLVCVRESGFVMSRAVSICG